MSEERLKILEALVPQLQAQRNQALDTVAELVAQYNILNVKHQELQATLDKVNALQKEEQLDAAILPDKAQKPNGKAPRLVE